jgi:hypothetical protein
MLLAGETVLDVCSVTYAMNISSDSTPCSTGGLWRAFRAPDSNMPALLHRNLQMEG